MSSQRHELTQELRHAARRLRRAPGFTAVVVLTLAVGIGGATALFCVVNSVLLRPLPYPEPDRLVRVFDTNREQSIEKTGVATGNLLEWRKRTQGFSALAGWYVMGRTLRTDRDVDVVRSAQVTEGFFPALNVQPALGRAFNAEEIARSVLDNTAAPVGTDVVIVISHRLWRSRFGGDPAILDKTVFVDRHAMRIIGVMPADFSFPNTDVDMWVPWGFRENPPKDQRYVKGIARLALGQTIVQAEAALQSTAAQLAAEFPAQNKGWSPILVPLQEELTGATRPALLLLFGAVCCVLLIGCVNVAHLQLIRASQFARETAVRLALGASRGRLLQQFGAESLLLALAGGIGGVLLAAGALQWLRWVQPAQLPRASEVTLHFTALLFAAGVTLLAGIVTGFAPALGAARTQLTRSLNEGGRSGVAGKPAQRLRNGLVVAEIAAAVVLLVSAGLLGRSFVRLLAVDPGFNYRNVLVLPIFLDNNEYTSGAKVRAYYAQLTTKLASLPGVISVGGATALPASPLGPDWRACCWFSLPTCAACANPRNSSACRCIGSWPRQYS